MHEILSVEAKKSQIQKLANVTLQLKLNIWTIFHPTDVANLEKLADQIAMKNIEQMNLHDLVQFIHWKVLYLGKIKHSKNMSKSVSDEMVEFVVKTFKKVLK